MHTIFFAVILITSFFLWLVFSPLASADENHENEGEAEYGSLAGFGFVLITIGTVFYSLGKRTNLMDFKKGEKIQISLHSTMPFLKIRFPLSLFDTHHILVVIGSVLTIPHYLSCEEYNTLFEYTGLYMGIVLIIENVSGFYGRFLHVKIERLRSQINHPFLKELLKKFRVWRTIHIFFTILLYVLLACHIALAN